MTDYDTFPAWEKIVEYFENSRGDPKTRIKSEGNINYEELLNIETYQLWKLLKKM
jgi:hypothetical protein